MFNVQFQSGMEKTIPTEESSTETVNPELELDGDMFANFIPKGYSFNVNEDELETIGEGSYGILYKTFDTAAGNNLALKKIKNA